MRTVIDHRTEANVPLEKLDHPAMSDFLQRRVPGAGRIPEAKSVRKWYLPTVIFIWGRDMLRVFADSLK